MSLFCLFMLFLDGNCVKPVYQLGADRPLHPVQEASRKPSVSAPCHPSLPSSLVGLLLLDLESPCACFIYNVQGFSLC